jgi:hypothetical protein
VSSLTPPAWATALLVEGDAAYGAHDTLQRVQQRDAAAPQRPWGGLFASARTWTTGEGQAIKDVGTQVPRKYFPRPWVPRIPATNGRKIFGRYSKRLGLRHLGDVTVVRSKPGRNVGPKHTQILVPHLPEWTPRSVVFASRRRWAVAPIHRELTSDLGLGEPQGSGEERRIEHSFGMAVMAYVVLIRLCHHELLPGRAWSVPPLQHAFRLRRLTKPVEHHVKMRLPKSRNAA